MFDAGPLTGIVMFFFGTIGKLKDFTMRLKILWLPTTIIYRGCISCKSCDSPPFAGAVRAIHQTPDFYKSDSTPFSPSLPARHSTLYWGPVIVTDTNGEADFNFYTNDLTGRFYIILQGISNEGTFSGRSSFKVQ
jgi:hypothetical protein